MYSLKEKVHTDSLTVILLIIGGLDKDAKDDGTGQDDSSENPGMVKILSTF